jgi:hypothetical protein
VKAHRISQPDQTYASQTSWKRMKPLPQTFRTGRIITLKHLKTSPIIRGHQISKNIGSEPQ